MAGAGGRELGHREVGLAVGGALAMATASSVALAVVHPLPAAHHYWLAVQLCAWLSALWGLWFVWPELIRRPLVLVCACMAGVAVGVGGLATVDRDSEMVHVYESVFEVLDDGGNPYTSDRVYHRDGNGEVVTGPFNYPPLELIPAVVARRIAGHWDAGVLTAMIVSINLLAGALLLWSFRHHLWWVLPWLPLVVLLDVKSNIAMTLLVTVLLVWAMRAGGDRPGSGWRLVVAVLFGLALTTKFLAIPLFAAYAWHELRGRRSVRFTMGPMEVVVAVATAIVVVAPFGPIAVLRSTIGFNLALGERQQLTTFYPNVLSGLCGWIGLPGAYGVLAVAVLAVAVLVAPRLELGLAMVLAATTFLLVAPTPEPQYVPVLLCLVLGLTWWRWEREEAATAGDQPPAAVVGTEGPATG